MFARSLLLALIILFTTPAFLFAEGELATSSGSSSVQSKVPMEGGVPPIESQSASSSASSPTLSSSVATATPAAGPAGVAPPLPSASDVSTGILENTAPAPSDNSPDTLPEEFPYLGLAVLIAIAIGAAFGALKMFGAGAQTKSVEKGNCENIKQQMEQKESEYGEVEKQITEQESALELLIRMLKEKIENKIDEKKDKLIKTIQNETKDTLLGKRGVVRQSIDAAESAYRGYKDLEAKVEEAKKLLALLQSKRDGLSKELQALESSYAVCIGAVASQVTIKGGAAGLELPYLTNPKAIIFDWGGVLANNGYQAWVRKNVQDTNALFSIARFVDDGSMSQEEFEQTLARVSGLSASEAWAGVKKEVVLNSTLVANIREWKRKYKIALLSNYSSPWLRELIFEYQVADLFDVSLISSEHKLAKPDPEIYKKILSMLGVSAKEAVFVDDLTENVEAARKLGFTGVLFTSNENLLKELKKLGISVNEKSPEA